MATTQQVQALFIGYFGRPADPSGLKFWSDGEKSTVAQLDALADQISGTPEYRLATAGLSTGAIVNNFYKNAFGREADPAGFAFWVNAIDTGLSSAEDIGVHIVIAALEAAVVDGETNSDQVAIQSKADAAELWTAEVDKSVAGILAYQGVEAVNTGISFLNPVTTKETVPTAAQVTADVNSLIAENSINDSNKLDLTTFNDVASTNVSLTTDGNGNNLNLNPSFRFSSEDQLVVDETDLVPALATINAGDVLSDDSTTDEDIFTIKLANTDNVGNIAAITTSNIENINLELSSARAGNQAFANFNGVDTVKVAGTLSDRRLGVQQVTGLALQNTGATEFDATAVTNNNGGGAFNVQMGNGSTIKAGDNAGIYLTGNGVNTFTGGSGGQQITTGTGADVINTGGGGDTVISGAGVDTIDAGEGNDQITAGTGADLITTGAGGDNLIYAASTQGTITNTGAAAAATVVFGAGLPGNSIATIVLNVAGIARTITTARLDGGGGGNTVDEAGALFVTAINAANANSGVFSSYSNANNTLTLTAPAGSTLNVNSITFSAAGMTETTTNPAAAPTASVFGDIDVISDMDFASDTITTQGQSYNGGAIQTAGNAATALQGATFTEAVQNLFTVGGQLQGNLDYGLFSYAGKSYLIGNNTAVTTLNTTGFSQADNDMIIDVTGFTGTLTAPNLA